MTKKEAYNQLKRIRRALNGLDGELIEKVLGSLPHEEVSPVNPKNGNDRQWTITFGDLTFDIVFNDGSRDSFVLYTARHVSNDGKTGVITVQKERRFSDSRKFGTGRHRYSLEDFCSMFGSEPFYLNHLTATDMRWYADAVRAEMEDWDYWLENGDVSEDKHSDHLCIQEEKILHEIAPYVSDLRSLDEILAQFDKNQD